MIYNFPFFPHFYSNPYYSYPQNRVKNVNNMPPTNVKRAYSTNNTSTNVRSNDMHSYNSNKQNRETNKNNQNNTGNSHKNDHLDFAFLDPDDTVFEIFGIKLHFDDILLICLIFFLYNEGVKDEFLFIVLVLLLLS